jgi:large subunit ribosomal protein L17
MRHGKKFNHLGRKKGHREAMLSNMASSLILHKRIFTTTAKAKALRVYVEPIITKAKEDSTHSRRVVFSYLQDKESVKELFGVIADKVGDRPGGYTRILKTGTRKGDNAEMCMMELVDFNELMLDQKVSKSSASTKSKRTRRGKKKATEAAPVAETVETTEATEAAAENTADNSAETAE